MINNNPTLNPEKWLSDFADNVIAGRPVSPSEPGMDSEMQALADVVVRLHQAFPSQDLEASVIKRMQGNVMGRWIEEEHRRKNSWTSIFNLDWLASGRSQLGWTLVVIAVAGIVLMSVPAVSIGSGAIAGTAGLQTPGVFLWFIPLAAVLAVAWLLRRKP